MGQHRALTDVTAVADADRPALLALWKQLFDTPPPAYAKVEFLTRTIAWEIQAREQGDLAPALRRRLHRIARGDASPAEALPAGARIKPGTRLLRTWQGETHEVLVLDEGLLWNGNRYGSLSAIAREITGTRWNGRRFFGLTGGNRDG